jgi:hypothetical protein
LLWTKELTGSSLASVDRHVGDLQIARGGFQIGMTKQDLNAPEVGAGFEQMGGACMPKGVRMNRFGDTGDARCIPASEENGFGGNRPGGIGARKQPVLRMFGAPVAAEQFQ